MHLTAQVPVVFLGCLEQFQVTAHSLQTGSHPVFRLAEVIFPTIVKERNAAIHGLPHKPYRRGLIRCISQMMSAKA